MYDIIARIVGHTWDNNINSSFQSAIVYSSCVAFLVLTVFILDKLFQFIISCAKRGN